MDQESRGLVALMSIKERFVSSIIRGTKRVEFRRIAFRKNITHVVVYESRGRGRIVGYFEVKRVANDSPEELWRAYSQVAGVDKAEFAAYFRGKLEGTGILIGSFYELQRPMKLAQLNPTYRPPQNFFYLDAEEFEKVRRRKALCVAA